VDPQNPPPKGETRYLEAIAGLFAGFLLISNLASTRLIQVGFLQFDAGTLMFPLTYIFGDLLTEVYGFAKSRKIIWIGFITLALATLVLYLTSLFPPAKGWENDAAWHAVMGLAPRIALASFVAYLVGEFANSITLAKMKARRPDQGPAGRFVVSTLVGQFFDTTLFCSIAFLGAIDFKLWLILLGSNYIFKVGVEIVLLPLTVLVVRRLKKSENLDPIDREVSLSPFRFNEKPQSQPLASRVPAGPSPLTTPSLKAPSPTIKDPVVLDKAAPETLKDAGSTAQEPTTRPSPPALSPSEETKALDLSGETTPSPSRATQALSEGEETKALSPIDATQTLSEGEETKALSPSDATKEPSPSEKNKALRPGEATKTLNPGDETKSS
jgi:uncharacterized integral membrane protein (TIGR00697 family)